MHAEISLTAVSLEESSSLNQHYHEEFNAVFISFYAQLGFYNRETEKASRERKLT